jgi:hypothetical protein
MPIDSGFRSPLVDLFARGEAARDVRLLAAQGALAPRVHEQMALLILLTEDTDPEISATANATLDALPSESLAAFLARPDVPAEMRQFFAARGGSQLDAPSAETAVLPHGAADDAAEDEPDEEVGEEEAVATGQVLSSLSIMQRMKLAMKGTKAQRAQLIRDSNKLVAAAVLGSPKLTESEVEAFAKMANVTEEVLRTIAMNRSWVKNYGVVAGLTRNPKTPPGISMQMVQRLNERDLKMLAIDRNVPEAVRLAARKFLRKGPKDMG